MAKTLPPGVLEALRKGNKIEAIKLLRAASKVGLAEAKNFIDALERQASQPSAPSATPSVDHSDHHPRIAPSAPHAAHPHQAISHSGLSPGEQPRNPSGLAFVVLVVVAAVAVYLFWKYA